MYFDLALAGKPPMLRSNALENTGSEFSVSLVHRPIRYQMKNLLLVFLFVPVVALAMPPTRPPSDFPSNCSKAHDIEEDAIPKILGLAPGSATVVSIRDLMPDVPAMPVVINTTPIEWVWNLQCVVVVSWSNGTQDFGYQFTIRTARYGGYDVGYNRPGF